MLSTRNRGTRPAAGAALVEAALFLPVLFILLAGIVNIGRMMAVRVSLANAAREGARYAAGKPTDFAGIGQTVVNELVGSNISVRNATLGTITTSGGMTSIPVLDSRNQTVATVTVTTPGGSSVGQRIIIGVVFPYRPILGTLIRLSTVSMTVRASMGII